MINKLSRFYEKILALDKTSSGILFSDSSAQWKQPVSAVPYITISTKNISAIDSNGEKGSLPSDKWGKANSTNNGKLAFWKRKKEVELLDTKISEISESINRIQEFVQLRIQLREDDYSDSIIDPISLDDEDWVELVEIIDDVYVSSSTKKLNLSDGLFADNISEFLSSVDFKEFLSELVVCLSDHREIFIIIKDKLEKSYALSLKLDIRREIRKFLKQLFRNNSDEEDILTSKTINEFFRIKILSHNENRRIFTIYRHTFS